MTADDLKYITQDDIDSASVNITSSEIYLEFQALNTHMLTMQRRRVKFLAEFYSMMLVNVVLIPIVDILSGKYTQLMEPVKEPAMAGLCIILLVLFLFSYCYFVLYKKNYDWKLCLGYTLLTLPFRASVMWYIMSLFYVGLNCWLARSMQDVDDMLKDQAGYPHFVQLVPSFLVDIVELDGKDAMDKFEDADESDDLRHKEDAPEVNPYDKYRIKPEDDQGMLRDVDINSPKE